MTMRRGAMLLVLGSVFGGCAGAGTQTGAQAPAPRAAQDTAGIAAQLMDADRAFAVATAARGLEGWMSFIAPDAVRMGRMADPVRGSAAIRASDAAIFADPAVRLTWAPTDAGAFDATHGWTVGRSQVHRRRPGGSDEVARSGRYVTIWRRGGEGRWLVVLDTGAPDPPPAR